jgi:hypothetical protein
LKDVIALVDLDDTLFQTIRKCPTDVPQDQLTPLGYDKDGNPLSYATPRQMRFLEWLLETTTVIPVTARSLDATRRVRFDYTRAICANGGVVLGEDGKPDMEWTRNLGIEAEPHRAKLEELLGKVRTLAGITGRSLRAWIIEELGVPCYLVIKDNANDATDVESLHAFGEVIRVDVPNGWMYHANGNNIAITPPHIGKATAVARMIPTLRAANPMTTIIGVGDSLTDGPFMALCDMAMCPPRSQIGAKMFAGIHK